MPSVVFGEPGSEDVAHFVVLDSIEVIFAGGRVGNAAEAAATAVVEAVAQLLPPAGVMHSQWS